MARKESWLPKRLPDDCSSLAHFAYDILAAGTSSERVFVDPGKGVLDAWLAENAKQLAAFLRSGEPIPDAIRLALADAIDGQGDPPVRISLKLVHRRRITLPGMLEQNREEDLRLMAYEKAIAETAPAPDRHEAALEAAAAAFDQEVIEITDPLFGKKTNTTDVVRMLSSARSRRDRKRKFDDAFGDGKTVKTPTAELVELLRSPLQKPKPGRKKKGT